MAYIDMYTPAIDAVVTLARNLPGAIGLRSACTLSRALPF